MNKTNLIIDGDWGGDEMQLLAVALAHPERINILGTTSVFGNAPHAQVLKNNGRILHLLGAGNIPYHAGCEAPTGEALPQGDGAHGDDGVGGVTLEDNPHAPQAEHAVDFILRTLRDAPEQSITITATGPLTNIATAFNREAHTMRRVREIVVMGGCVRAMPAADMPVRQGNITPRAEFNFYMAPRDARLVMKSGLPITLFPMDATHQLTFTPQREADLRAALQGASPDKVEAVIAMIAAPAEFERKKFGIPPVMHDVHTALHLVAPDLYHGQQGRVQVAVDGDARGHTIFTPDPRGNVRVVERVKNADALFRVVERSLKICLQ